MDRNKILTYDYDKDIKHNQDRFIQDICSKLSINGYDKSQPLDQKVLETKNKPKLECDKNLLDTLQKQMDKFNQIR